MPSNEQNRSNSLSYNDVQVWLQEHGDVMYRFALRRVDDPETAEDLVQDTFVSAIKAHDSFAGRSTIRTWLVGILRKKIIDHIRRKTTERKAKGIQQQEQIEAKSFFDNKGHWRKTVRPWPDDPEKPLEDEEFWRALDACTQKLTGPVADAFRLRDIEQISTAEVCRILGISATNLSVRLHRARLLLRDCLEKNWFRGETSD